MSEGTTLANDIPKQLSDGNSVGTTLGLAGIMPSSGTTDKISFFGATPVVIPVAAGTSAGFTAGAGTTVTSLSTFTGGVGVSAYTLGDIVLALKQLGLVTQ